MSLVNLLISDDSVAVGQIRALHRQIDGIELQVLPSLALVERSCSRMDVVLTIVHLAKDSDGAHALRLLDQKNLDAPSNSFLFLADGVVSPTIILKLLHAGAVDCLRMPFEESKIRFLVESRTLRRRVEYKKRQIVLSDPNITALNPVASRAPDFLSISPIMSPIMDRVKRIANLDNTVLLSGETGTGKTRMARLIHDQSDRRDRPFIHVDCASISDDLIENELFGHSKGAYTGADKASEGKIAAARNGTVFLDEVDALSPKGQASLLRLADEGRFTPVGGTQEVTTQARLIVGTNRDLAVEVDASRFRRDLYYRLNVLVVKLPPLRERAEDVPHLVKLFINSTAEKFRMARPVVEDSVWDALKRHDWPGNIRELKNAIEQMMAFCTGGKLTLSDLPESFRTSRKTPVQSSELATSVLEDDSLEDPNTSHPPVTDSWIVRRFPDLKPIGLSRVRGEIGAIVSALTESKNNRTLAAEFLGISRESLYQKLKKYGLMDFRI